jgi:tRNA G10  N-methylase Trm11
MDMKKLLMVLALSLPLMAQQVEVKEVDGNTEVTVKKQHDKKGGWKRGDGRMMEQRKQKARHMRKKRAIRSVVRIIVVGGVAYYIGYHKGQHNKHPMKRKPYMGDRK